MCKPEESCRVWFPKIVICSGTDQPIWQNLLRKKIKKICALKTATGHNSGAWTDTLQSCWNICLACAQLTKIICLRELQLFKCTLESQIFWGYIIQKHTVKNIKFYQLFDSKADRSVFSHPPG